MSKQEIDAYLAGLDEPKRSSLEILRERILVALPEAEQCISYGMPAFRVQGKVLAGFAAFKHHLAYLPHRGRVFSEIPELDSFEKTTGSLHFEIDQPLSQEIVNRLVQVRRAQALGN